MSDEGVTRATFWLGGQDAHPGEASVEAPIWSGRILNLSTGGLLVRTSYEAAKYVEVGDIVGVQVIFGKGDPVMVDAQLRHVARDGEMALIGLQFVEDRAAPDRNAGVRVIREKIARQHKEQDQPA